MRIGTSLLLAALFIAAPAAARAKDAISATDYIEIQNLYARYNHAHDGSNRKLLESVFSEDGEFFNNGKPVKGREMIPATAVAKDRPIVRHVATSITVEPTPGGAKGTSYVVLVNAQASPAGIMLAGFYEDVLVKTAQGWRFKTRNFYPQAPPPAAAPATK
jgi:hypothetical protein